MCTWGLQAQLNAKLARRQRELEEEEAERKRKDAAAAKLRALDEAIAAREAESVCNLAPCLEHKYTCSCPLGRRIFDISSCVKAGPANQRAHEAMPAC